MLFPSAGARPLRAILYFSVALALTPLTGQAADSTAPAHPPLEWRKFETNNQFLAEGAAFGDLNRDNQIDAVAGPYWYEGPDFSQRHDLYPAVAFDPLQYSDNFLTFVHDFNADGWADVLVVGWPGKEAFWLENPHSVDGAWNRHLAFDSVDSESPALVSLLDEKNPVLICMNGGRIGYAAPDPLNPTKPWTFHAITPPGSWHRYSHGLGSGDVNGDGRADILEKDGWWEQPATLDGDPIWKKHAANFGDGGAQMYVYDVNADGRADVITSINGHGYGLSWFEQLPGNDGSAFREHVITSRNPQEKISGVQFSQLHAIALVDVDGDGLSDIVTGKRWWAHGPDKDPDPNGTPVLYAFLLRRSPDGTANFAPHLIDDASGVGTRIDATDLNHDGRADIISSNKRGTFVFVSQLPHPTK
ncbi:MAG TPA: VCBS repeat-containing protein [Opitutus sp.]|nr:VCBS repeat-containing protein [Opitutus sp.]